MWLRENKKTARAHLYVGSVFSIYTVFKDRLNSIAQMFLNADFYGHCFSVIYVWNVEYLYFVERQGNF